MSQSDHIRIVPNVTNPMKLLLRGEPTTLDDAHHTVAADPG